MMKQQPHEYEEVDVRRALEMDQQHLTVLYCGKQLMMLDSIEGGIVLDFYALHVVL